MRLHLRHKHDHLGIDLQREGKRYRAIIDGVEHSVEVQYLDASALLLTVDSQQYRVAIARDQHARYVAIGAETYRFMPEAAASAHSVETTALPELAAPMPGRILQVLVQPGDRVDAGDALLILEAMKMETRLLAEAPGTVAEVRAAGGDMVDGGQVLVVLRYDEAPGK